ncbi:hypothetical protein KEM55_008776 [Ascosphaera atra]|nr:hypothetical protein KEM55_008776 [Ascosphaera atra]
MAEPITSCDEFKALVMNAQQQQQQQPPRPRPQPPQSQLPTALTIDDLVNALLKTIFNPYLAWVLPAITLALKRDVRNSYFLAFTAYEALLLLIVYLSELNNTIAYGRPRRMDWEREVVLVAGGASGVGWEIARMYAEKGVKVAVVDIQRPAEGFAAESENLRVYECDVSDVSRLEEVAEQIRDDLGTPTILIHSIATTIT